MDIEQNTEVNATSLAVVLGVTARRVRQLAQDGIISAKGKGKYNLPDAVQRYMAFREREKSMTKAELDRQDAEVSIKKAKAIMTVLEAKELQGKMHSSDDVSLLTEDLIFTIRGMLMAVPGRLAIDTANANNPNETTEILRIEMYKIMDELSRYEYDDSKYLELVRDRLKWADNNQKNGDDDD